MTRKHHLILFALCTLLLTLVGCDGATSNQPSGDPYLILTPAVSLTPSTADLALFTAAQAKAGQLTSFHFVASEVVETHPLSGRNQSPTTTQLLAEGDATVRDGKLLAIRHTLKGNNTTNDGEWIVIFDGAGAGSYRKMESGWTSVAYDRDNFQPRSPGNMGLLVALLGDIPGGFGLERVEFKGSQPVAEQPCNYYTVASTYGGYTGYWVSQQSGEIVQIVNVNRDGGDRPSSMPADTPLTDVALGMTLSRINEPVTIEAPVGTGKSSRQCGGIGA